MRLPLLKRARTSAPRIVSARAGYDIWSSSYDTQPNNAVLELESRLFTEFLSRVALRDKVVVDIGCGTGRHWPEILAHQPARLIGVDPSPGMLQRLALRYPDAEMICADGASVPALESHSCDVVISTLALAHAADARAAIQECARVLKPAGSVVLVDFHPDASQAGMKRSFVEGGETLEIEQYPVAIEQLTQMFCDSGLEIALVAERAIDETVRPLFEAVDALDKYNAHIGLNLVFGILAHSR